MDTRELTLRASERIREGQPLMLVHIISSEGSTPRGNDAYMIVDRDGISMGTVGGGKVEYRATLDAVKLLAEGASGKKSYSLSREDVADLGMICGGNVDMEFVLLKAGEASEREASLNCLSELERAYLESQNRVIIFGAGHVAMATVPLLENIGFSCTVYDDRAEFASEENFPEADRIICDSYEDVLKKVDVGERDYVIIMTRGHQYDYEIQKQILRTKAMFIGVIGSRAKLETISEKLIKDGYSKEDIDRFYAPLGLQIAAETPEEIAVSIAAELILVRANAEGRRKVRQGRTLKLSDIRSPK